MDAILIYHLALGGVTGGISSLVSTSLIRSRIKQKSGNAKLRELVASEIASSAATSLQSEIMMVFDNFMSDKLVKKLPVLNMFIDEQLISEIRTVFHEEMDLQLPGLMQKTVENEALLNALFDRLTQTMNRHIRSSVFKITMSGVAIGFFIGYLFFSVTFFDLYY